MCQVLIVEDETSVGEILDGFFDSLKLVGGMNRRDLSRVMRIVVCVDAGRALSVKMEYAEAINLLSRKYANSVRFILRGNWSAIASFI